MQSYHKTTWFYLLTGIAAIIAGGLVSAFLAKQPSTFAMWASAYLVLVVGLVQVFLGVVPAQPHTATEMGQTFWAYGLFNVGNILVIISTGMKYAHHGGNVPVTIVGSLILVVGLAMLGWRMRHTPASLRKNMSYVVIIGIALSALAGMFLAQQ